MESEVFVCSQQQNDGAAASLPIVGPERLQEMGSYLTFETMEKMVHPFAEDFQAVGGTPAPRRVLVRKYQKPQKIVTDGQGKNVRTWAKAREERRLAREAEERRLREVRIIRYILLVIVILYSLFVAIYIYFFADRDMFIIR